MCLRKKVHNCSNMCKCAKKGHNCTKWVNWTKWAKRSRWSMGWMKYVRSVSFRVTWDMRAVSGWHVLETPSSWPVYNLNRNPSHENSSFFRYFHALSTTYKHLEPSASLCLSGFVIGCIWLFLPLPWSVMFYLGLFQITIECCRMIKPNSNMYWPGMVLGWT